MTDLILLRAPPGADGGAISHDWQQFFPFRADPADPASPWLVWVHREAAIHFIHNAGFSLMPDESQVPAPVGMALLAHPDGPTMPDGSSRTLGIGGVSVAPGADGKILIPANLVPEALAHGWDAPERVATTLRQKLEEALGLVDGTEVNKEIAAAVAQATAQANAERDAALARAETAEADSAATLAAGKTYMAAAEAANASLTTELAAGVVAMDLAKKDLAGLRAEIGTRDKQIAGLKAQLDAQERETTKALNELQVAEGAAASKKK